MAQVSSRTKQSVSFSQPFPAGRKCRQKANADLNDNEQGGLVVANYSVHTWSGLHNLGSLMEVA